MPANDGDIVLQPLLSEDTRGINFEVDRTVVAAKKIYTFLKALLDSQDEIVGYTTRTKTNTRRYRRSSDIISHCVDE